MKRKLLKWGIWLLVILLVCGAVFLMPSGSRVGYGIEKGSVDFTDAEFDITDFLKDGENNITVSVAHRSPNTRWYSGAGIYRKSGADRYQRTPDQQKKHQEA